MYEIIQVVEESTKKCQTPDSQKKHTFFSQIRSTWISSTKHQIKCIFISDVCKRANIGKQLVPVWSSRVREAASARQEPISDRILSTVFYTDVEYTDTRRQTATKLIRKRSQIVEQSRFKRKFVGYFFLLLLWCPLSSYPLLNSGQKKINWTRTNKTLNALCTRKQNRARENINCACAKISGSNWRRKL